MWTIHALISLALNVLTGSNARHRALRSVSKGFFAEASTVRYKLRRHADIMSASTLCFCGGDFGVQD